MLDLVHARERMVDLQIARRGIRDSRVLDAMRRVPREAFVNEGLEEFAYEDSPLPIGEGQTISQPYVVALMIEAAGIKPGERVLEVGAGSGYAAAAIAQIARTVYAIERHASLAQRARGRFKRLGYENIEVRTGDGTFGWPEAAPFDAVLVAAGAHGVPQALRDQLAIGGRLIIPVGEFEQTLLRITRKAETKFEQEDLGAVMFVPLVSDVEEAPRRSKRRIPRGSRWPRRP